MKKLVLYTASILLTSLVACNEHVGSWGELIITSPSKSSITRIQTSKTITVSAKPLGEDVVHQYKIQLLLASSSLDIDSSTTEQAYVKNFLYISEPNETTPTIEKTITIPKDYLPGNYSLLVSAIINGNSEARDTVQVTIFNEIDTLAPTVSIIYPENNTTIGKSDSLQIGIYTSDLFSNNQEGSLYDISIDMIHQDSQVKINLFKTTRLKQAGFELDNAIKLPAGIAGGNYKLQVTSVDRYNNVAIESVAIKVE